VKTHDLEVRCTLGYQEKVQPVRYYVHDDKWGARDWNYTSSSIAERKLPNLKEYVI